jgi:hypothetical protein
MTDKEIILDKALELYIEWAENCDFGYDNIDNLENYKKYQDEIDSKNMGYCEGLKYIAIQEAIRELDL